MTITQSQSQNSISDAAWQTVKVGFGDWHVAVHSSSSEIADRHRHHFIWLVDDRPTQSAGELMVIENSGLYSMKGNRVFFPAPESPEDVARCLSHETLLYFVDSCSDLIWLHGGAVSNGDNGLLFVGKWGTGKSSLVAELCQSGWRYLSDDVAPIEPTTNTVAPFPKRLVVRQSGRRMLPEDEVNQLPRSHVTIPSRSVASSPMPITGIVFPRFEAATPSAIAKARPGHAVLRLMESHMQGVSQQTNRADYFCSLVERVPCFDLSFDEPRSGADQVKHAFQIME